MRRASERALPTFEVGRKNKKPREAKVLHSVLEPGLGH